MNIINYHKLSTQGQSKLYLGVVPIEGQSSEINES